MLHQPRIPRHSQQMTLFHVSLWAFLCQFLPNVNATLGIIQNVDIVGVFFNQLSLTLSQNGDDGAVSLVRHAFRSTRF